MVGGAQKGPLELDDLRMAIRRGEVSSSTPALIEGHDNWIDLGNIPELQADLADAPKAPSEPLEWYYLDGDKTCGPNTTEEIQYLLSSGSIPVSTWLFREGMKDWAQAESLEEFNVHASLGNDTSLPVVPQSPPVSNIPKSMRTRLVAGCLVGVLMLGIAGWYWTLHVPQMKEAEQARLAVITQQRNAEQERLERQKVARATADAKEKTRADAEQQAKAETEQEAKAEAAQHENQFAYTTNNGTITITQLIGSNAVVIIPSTINSRPVTGIGDKAFARSTNLTSVTIPNSVTSIGDGAFDACTSLTSVTIPNGVTSIRQITFDLCISLTNITIPNGVTNIQDYAFYDCKSLTSVTIPESVTSIGNQAFYYCTSLTKITFGLKDTHLGDDAFKHLTGRPIANENPVIANEKPATANENQVPTRPATDAELRSLGRLVGEVLNPKWNSRTPEEQEKMIEDFVRDAHDDPYMIRTLPPYHY